MPEATVNVGDMVDEVDAAIAFYTTVGQPDRVLSPCGLSGGEE